MRTFYCLLLILCLLQYGLAQPLPRPYRVGDTIPAITFSNLLDTTVTPIRIPSIDKYMLLDFWASNCRSCLEGFEKVHDLQGKYPDRLQVLMVNSYARDTREKIAAIFRRRKDRTGRDFLLPCLLEDSLLQRMFPYTYLPQYVWISPGGSVTAITGPEELTEANILQWLTGKPLQLQTKTDSLRYDVNSKLPLSGDTASDDALLYSCRITGYKKGLGTAVGTGVTTTGLTHGYFINSSLLALYQHAWPGVFTVPYRQIQIGKGMESLFFDSMGKRPYCYEWYCRPGSQAQELAAMRAELERCFRLTAVNEYQPVNCYVLTANKDVQKAFTKGGEPTTDVDSLSLKKYIRNQPLAEVLAVIGYRLPLQLIDETGLKQSFDIRFPDNFYQLNPQQLAGFLRNYGLVLSPAKRTLRLAVLKPVTGANQPCSSSNFTK